MSDYLQAVGITKHYGGVYALKGANFDLRAGEVHALVGENGAGKSTLARILAGSTRADGGVISLHGAPVEIATPLDAQRLGIGIIYQELDLFPNLTVGENIVIGNLHFAEGLMVSFRRMEEFCRPFLDQVGLACDIRQTVATLSIGQMQLLAIARALSMDVRIILMDEPTSSLFEDAAERLFGLIAALKQRGVSIVYVSHKMDEIFRVCDRATVLRDGETAGTVELAGAGVNDLIRMMVGRELQFAARAARRPAGEIVLTAENLTTSKIKNVSFELRRGEVLGIAGLVGSGRSELGAALFGIDRIESGTLRVQGGSIAPRSPRDAMASGIGLLPEDRRLQGLMMRMSVLENATLAVLPEISGLGFIHRGQEFSAVAPVARRLELNCPSTSAPVSQLSGGNQQKVLLARWLLLNPSVLFLDDPTRGIDIGAKQDIYRLIDQLASDGKAIILVSSELPELLRCCDRILVLNEGRVTADYDAGDATQEKIMSAATNAGVRDLMQSVRAGAGLLRRAQSLAALLGILILAIVISPTASDGSRIFLQAGNLTDILRQVSLIGIISLAMTFVILTGGIDLSVGSILALSTALVAMFLTRGYTTHIAVAILAAVAAAALAGALNGAVVAFTGIQPFIVTLASMIGVRGLAKWLTNNQNIDIGFGKDLASEFAAIFREKAIVIGAYAIAAAMFWVVLARTVFGRHVRAVGDNEKAAEYAGLPIRATKIWVYTLSGLFTGFAGVLYAAENHQGNPNAGVAYELDAIAAVVIGGTRLSGGKGSISGTIVGTLIMGVLTNMLRLNNVDSNVEMMIKAVIIVLAVAVQRERNGT